MHNFTKKYPMRTLLSIFLLLIAFHSALPQDEATYKKQVSGFYQDSILPGINSFQEKSKADGQAEYLSLDFSTLKFPGKIQDYSPLWHNPPLSQGATGTCWCFSTISFLESEIYRKTGKEIKLSEMYVVYWEYVARAKYYVEHRGDMYFGQGSETNAVTRIIREHGLVPAQEYTGMLKGQRFHNHNEMEKEIGDYLAFIREHNIWDENAVVANVKSILDHYMGTPPQEVTYKGEQMSPIKFMNQVAQVSPDDYFCFMSTKSIPYNQKGELKEPDNWWHSDDYYNISLEDFTGLFVMALEEGYTLSICGDVSEPGYDRFAEVGIIPSFDIPRDLIDENAREMRLYNGSTTDDHCIHIVGYTRFDNDLWYLIKDSAAGGFDGPNKGYRFVREDYVKLKFIAVMTHKYAAKKILDRIIK